MRALTDALTALDVQLGTTVQELYALKKWRAMECYLDFLGSLGIRIWWLGCPFSRKASQILPRTLDGLGQWSSWKTWHLMKKKISEEIFICTVYKNCSQTSFLNFLNDLEFSKTFRMLLDFSKLYSDFL
jgi:hypothetical protein